MFQVPRRIRSVLSRLLGGDCMCSGEEREAELHLYAVSRASRLYLHLQSSWNRFIIVSEDRQRLRVISRNFTLNIRKPLISSHMYKFLIFRGVIMQYFLLWQYNADITHNARAQEKEL